MTSPSCRRQGSGCLKHSIPGRLGVRYRVYSESPGEAAQRQPTLSFTSWVPGGKGKGGWPLCGSARSPTPSFPVRLCVRRPLPVLCLTGSLRPRRQRKGLVAAAQPHLETQQGSFGKRGLESGAPPSPAPL